MTRFLTKRVVIFLAVILIIGGGIFLLKKHGSKKSSAPNNPSSGVYTPDQSKPHVNPPGGETNIPIVSGKFDPELMTVATGTQINWINNDSVKHTVVSDDDAFKSDDINPGQIFSFTFSKAGEYKYHDGNNPNTKATLIVKDIQQ